jgi:hypothetical protein
VDKRTAKQSKLRQFETDPRQENFLLKFLDLIIHHEVPILKLFSQQDLVDKTTAHHPKVQEFESTRIRRQRHLVTNTTYSVGGEVGGGRRRITIQGSGVRVHRIPGSAGSSSRAIW